MAITTCLLGSLLEKSHIAWNMYFCQILLIRDGTIWPYIYPNRIVNNYIASFRIDTYRIVMTVSSHPYCWYDSDRICVLHFCRLPLSETRYEFRRYRNCERYQLHTCSLLTCSRVSLTFFIHNQMLHIVCVVFFSLAVCFCCRLLVATKFKHGLILLFHIKIVFDSCKYFL